MLPDASPTVSRRHTAHDQSDSPLMNRATGTPRRIISVPGGGMVAGSQTTGSRRRRVHGVSAVSATMMGALFLIGAAGLLASILQLDSISRWLVPLQNNWLVVLFSLNVPVSGAHLGMLNLNLLDVILIVLACPAFLGLYPIGREVSKTWTLLALALPPTGLLLFLITGMQGRLGIVSAMLTISVLMLRSDSFGSVASVLGVLAGTLLIAGEILTEAAYSSLNCLPIATGYVFMVAWLFAISRRPFQISRTV